MWQTRCRRWGLGAARLALNYAYCWSHRAVHAEAPTHAAGTLYVAEHRSGPRGAGTSRHEPSRLHARTMANRFPYTACGNHSPAHAPPPIQAPIVIATDRVLTFTQRVSKYTVSAARHLPSSVAVFFRLADHGRAHDPPSPYSDMLGKFCDHAASIYKMRDLQLLD